MLNFGTILLLFLPLDYEEIDSAFKQSKFFYFLSELFFY